MAAAVKEAFENAQKQIADFKPPESLDSLQDLTKQVEDFGNKEKVKSLILGEYIKKLKDPNSETDKKTKDVADFATQVEEFQKKVDTPFNKDINDTKGKIDAVSSDVQAKVVDPLSAPGDAVAKAKKTVDDTVGGALKQMEKFDNLLAKIPGGGDAVENCKSKIKEAKETFEDIQKQVMSPINELLDYLDKVKAPAVTFDDTLSGIVSQLNGLQKEYNEEEKHLKNAMDELTKLKKTDNVTQHDLEHGADKVEHNVEQMDLGKLSDKFVDLMPKIKDQVVDGTKQMLQDIQNLLGQFGEKTDALTEGMSSMTDKVNEKTAEIKEMVDSCKPKMPEIPKPSFDIYKIFFCCKRPQDDAVNTDTAATDASKERQERGSELAEDKPEETKAKDDE